MKLLIITQKVDKNDPVLGFFHRWIEEFAKHCESVVVICLEEGKHELPSNVKVLSLDKEGGASRIKYISRFYGYIWNERKNYDNVFVHMNPEYIALGGPIWKIMNKKVALWYTHRQSNPKLWIAEKFADVIFTSSKESFTLKSRKVSIMGHGIDTGKFASSDPVISSLIQIAHIGRVTGIKNLDVIMRAIKDMQDESVDAQLHIVGAPLTEEDKKTKIALEDLSRSLGIGDRIIWDGSMPAADALSNVYLTVNAAPEGGMDKSVLESIAARRPVFVANRAFESLFGQYWHIFSYGYGDHQDLARKINEFIQMEESSKLEMLHALEKRIRTEYDIRTLISRIEDKISNI